jgi:hypothetical protein
MLQVGLQHLYDVVKHMPWVMVTQPAFHAPRTTPFIIMCHVELGLSLPGVL